MRRVEEAVTPTERQHLVVRGDLHRRLKIEAATRGVPLRDVADEVLERYFGERREPSAEPAAAG